MTNRKNGSTLCPRHEGCRTKYGQFSEFARIQPKRSGHSARATDLRSLQRRQSSEGRANGQNKLKAPSGCLDAEALITHDETPRGCTDSPKCAQRHGPAILTSCLSGIAPRAPFISAKEASWGRPTHYAVSSPWHCPWAGASNFGRCLIYFRIRWRVSLLPTCRILTPPRRCCVDATRGAVPLDSTGDLLTWRIIITPTL
jgi:hypothetical protein